MNRCRKRADRLWWLAAGAILAAEIIVYARSLPEKLRWFDEPVLALDLPEDYAGDGLGHSYRDEPERLGGSVQQLAYATGRCGVFLPETGTGPSSRRLDFFYFEYDPGNPRFLHDVFGHLPEACMSATGAVLKAEHEPREIIVAGRRHRVLVLEFVSPVSSEAMWVFRFTWLPEGTPFDPYEAAYTRRGEKFLAGLLGIPKPPARVLLAGALGYPSLDEAWADYETLLVSRLRLNVNREP